MESNGPLKVMPRACTNCRLRKIRCNRTIPCTSCTASGLTCRSGGKTVLEPVPATAINEQHFERLHERLASVEDAINRLSEHGLVRQPHHFQQTNKQHPDCIGNQPIDETDEDGTRFPEGDSSFGQQTMVASQIAQLNNSQSGDSGSSADIAREIGILKQLLNEDPTFSQAGHLQSLRMISQSARSVDELLPTDFVLRLLRIVDDTKPFLFTFHGLQDRTQIEEICTRVYFPVHPAAAIDVTLCHGLLETILRDPDVITHCEITSEEAREYRQRCKNIFEVGVESYEVAAVPTFKHAMVLSLAMSYAQSEARLPLQWTATSIAARHCLALGYHREERLSQLPPLKAKRSRWLFWHIYTSDKNLSSRLGRTSVIQDYDLDTKLCCISRDPGRAPWDQAAMAFVELSRIQGHIYEALYSASASSLDTSERSRIVSSLSERLTQWHNGWRRIDPSCAHHRQRFEHTFGPVDIVYYSISTLLHRGATPFKSMLNITPACLEAAYRCLNAHLAYSSTLEPSVPYICPGYAIWIFNFTSFTAFIVTFTHCIISKSASDLELLRKVLLSLEQIATHFEYSKWQFNLCNALYRIADAFMKLQREGNHIAADLENPFLDNWSWLDANLASMLGISR